MPPLALVKCGAAAMEDQRWIKANVAALTGALQGAASLEEFGERLVSGLAPVLGGGAAAFFVAGVTALGVDATIPIAPPEERVAKLTGPGSPSRAAGRDASD